MATASFDGVKVAAIIPAAGTTTQGFAVPRLASVMTVFSPATLVTSTQWWLESLVPSGYDSTTWDKLWIFPGLVATPTVPLQLLVTFHANDAVVIPANMLGGGTLRIALTDAQTNGQTFYVFFSQFQN